MCKEQSRAKIKKTVFLHNTWLYYHITLILPNSDGKIYFTVVSTLIKKVLIAVKPKF